MDTTNTNKPVEFTMTEELKQELAAFMMQPTKLDFTNKKSRNRKYSKMIEAYADKIMRP
jgi:hypothetical protein